MKPANSRLAANLGGAPLLISALPAIPRLYHATLHSVRLRTKHLRLRTKAGVMKLDFDLFINYFVGIRPQQGKRKAK